jgi:hypothetical protein
MSRCTRRCSPLAVPWHTVLPPTTSVRGSSTWPSFTSCRHIRPAATASDCPFAETLARFISNWCVIAICLVIALPAVIKITEPTEQEARGDYVSEAEDQPGARRKLEAAQRHGELVHEKEIGAV